MTRDIQRMAIVGTGVMGSGIAQIAAQAGIQVKLFDAREGAAQSARDNLGRTLGKLAEKGKITAEDADATLARLLVAGSLAELADSELVVEAIVERLDAKQALLAELEAVVADDCILATNTSSLSVTSIARGCRHPHAARILAQNWTRILWRCWHDHTPYNPDLHGRLNTLLTEAA